MGGAKKNRRALCNGHVGNKKKNWKRLQQRRRAEIQVPAIKKAWVHGKTVQENLKNIGLAFNPNNLKELKKRRYQAQSIEVADIKQQKEEPKVTSVIEEMELQASMPEKEKKFRVSEVEVEWCTKMLNLYGENYKRMSKDRMLNLDQLTDKQCRNKIRTFKRCKAQYSKFIEERKQLQEEFNSQVAME